MAVDIDSKSAFRTFLLAMSRRARGVFGVLVAVILVAALAGVMLQAVFHYNPTANHIVGLLNDAEIARLQAELSKAKKDEGYLTGQLAHANKTINQIIVAWESKPQNQQQLSILESRVASHNLQIQSIVNVFCQHAGVGHKTVPEICQ